MPPRRQYGVDPKPRKPFTAYFQWAEERKRDLMDMEFKARQQLLGNEWKAMSNSQRNVWKAKADEDLKGYEKQLAAWYVRHPEERADEQFSRMRSDFTKIFFYVCYLLRLVEMGQKLELDQRQNELLAKEFISLRDEEKQEWHSLAALCESREEEKAEVLNVWSQLNRLPE